jgi:hypothetical protein
MQNNIIDAREMFLGRALLAALDAKINAYKEQYRSYYLLVEEYGEDFIELRLHDLNEDMHIVIDKAPMIVYLERQENGQALFEI